MCKDYFEDFFLETRSLRECHDGELRMRGSFSKWAYVEKYLLSKIRVGRRFC